MTISKGSLTIHGATVTNPGPAFMQQALKILECLELLLNNIKIIFIIFNW